MLLTIVGQAPPPANTLDLEHIQSVSQKEHYASLLIHSHSEMHWRKRILFVWHQQGQLSYIHTRIPCKNHYQTLFSYPPMPLQHQINVIHFDSLMKAVADDYVDGFPRHLSLPATSSFAIMTAEEFDNLDDAEALRLFATKNIVTTGHPAQNTHWSEDSLSRLAHMDAVIDVQGNSAKAIDSKTDQYLQTKVSRPKAAIMACAFTKEH